MTETDYIENHIGIFGIGQGINAWSRFGRAINLAADAEDRFSVKQIAILAGYGALAGGIARFFTGAARVAGDFDARTVGIAHNLQGGQDAAQALVEKLMEMSTGPAAALPIEKTISYEQRLLALGFTATQSTRIIKDMSDAVANVGGDPSRVEGLLRTFARIQAVGRITIRDLWTLANAGVPVQAILREQLHLTEQQFRNLSRLPISGKDLLGALLRGIEQHAGGATERFLNTLPGQMNRIHNSWVRFQASFGTMVQPLAITSLNVIGSMVDTFNRAPAAVRTMVAMGVAMIGIAAGMRAVAMAGVMLRTATGLMGIGGLAGAGGGVAGMVAGAGGAAGLFTSAKAGAASLFTLSGMRAWNVIGVLGALGFGMAAGNMQRGRGRQIMGSISGGFAGGLIGQNIGAWTGGVIGSLVNPGGGTAAGAGIGAWIGRILGTAIGVMAGRRQGEGGAAGTQQSQFEKDLLAKMDDANSSLQSMDESMRPFVKVLEGRYIYSIIPDSMVTRMAAELG